MASVDERIEAAQQRLQQLKAEKQRHEAKLRLDENKKARKEDNRRKMLIGAAVMKKWPSGEIKGLMDEFLVRSGERALFGLPPKP